MTSLILIAALGQGLFLCACLLFARRANAVANRLLAGLLHHRLGQHRQILGRARLPQPVERR